MYNIEQSKNGGNILSFRIIEGILAQCAHTFHLPEAATQVLHARLADELLLFAAQYECSRFHAPPERCSHS